MDERFLKISLGWLFLLTMTSASAASLSIRQNAYQYAGEYTDNESHLQYLNARYYNVETIRFVSRDTYQNKSNVFDNTYNYGAGNPVSNEDPSGHVIWDALEERLPKENESFVQIFAEGTKVETGIEKEVVVSVIANNVAETEIDILRRQLAEANAQVVRLKNKNRELRSELNVVEGFLQGNSIEARLAVAQLEMQNFTLQQRNQLLERALENSYARNAVLSEENSALRAENHELSTYVLQLETHHSQATDLRRQNRSLLIENAHLNEMLGFRERQGSDLGNMYI